MIQLWWAHAEGMYALPLFSLIFISYVWWYKRCSRALRMWGRWGEIIHFSSYRRITKLFLRTAALIFISIAWHRPQWGKVEQEVSTQGRHLFILLDVSRSMLATDVGGTRLEGAKRKIRSLLEEMPSEQVGLILFSGSAFLQCPLTIDHAALRLFLDQVEVESIASGSTSLENALSVCMNSFKQYESIKHKLALIVTDGEDFSPFSTQMAKKAQEEGITLMAIGIGTPEGAPIPMYDAYGKKSGFYRDEKGSICLSKLDEEKLKNLVGEKGAYARCTKDDSDILSLRKTIESVEKETLATHKRSEFEERYPLFVGGAFICLLLEWII